MIAISKYVVNVFKFLKTYKPPQKINAYKYSWDEVEAYYRQLLFSGEQAVVKKAEILSLIKEIRNKGFEEKLFASVSVYWLRCFRVSLSDGIYFDWTNHGMRVMKGGIMNNRVILFEHPRIEYCTELERILEELSNS